MKKFFILAGGYGKRAEPLSWIKPKALFPINGIPLLQIMLEQLKKDGWTEGYINVHHLPDQIEHLIDTIQGMNIRIIYEKELHGSAILSEVAHEIKEEGLLVINGDIFLQIPLQEIQALRKNAHGVLLTCPVQPGYPTLHIQKGYFKHVNRVHIAAHPSLQMYTGVALFSSELVREIRKVNFFHILENSSFQIRCLQYQGIWMEMGTPASYFSNTWRYQSFIGGSTSSICSQGVSLSPESRLHKSIIWENCRLTGRCQITESIITSNLCLDNAQVHRKIVTHQGMFPLHL